MSRSFHVSPSQNRRGRSPFCAPLCAVHDTKRRQVKRGLSPSVKRFRDGLKISILLPTLLTLLALSSVAVAADPNAPIRVEDYQNTIHVACVGDSITAGVGADPGRDYPAQLGKLLGSKWEVRNFGVSGSTLLNHGDKPYHKENAFKAALAYQPDVVLIMLGTNDTKPQNWKLKDQFAADYKDLIGQFAKLPSKPRIFICRPVPVPGAGNYGINEAGVKEEIPLIDKVAADTTSGEIDMHAALADHPETLPDRVHPNTAGAEAMAKAASKALTGK